MTHQAKENRLDKLIKTLGENGEWVRWILVIMFGAVMIFFKSEFVTKSELKDVISQQQIAMTEKYKEVLSELGRIETESRNSDTTKFRKLDQIEASMTDLKTQIIKLDFAGSKPMIDLLSEIKDHEVRLIRLETKQPYKKSP